MLKEIYKRRSYHDGFDDSRTISEEDINEILKAGMNAPSTDNTQPWEFVVVDDRELLVKLSRVTAWTKATATASHAIIICAEPDELQEMNVGIAVQNLALAAANLDVGSLIMAITIEDAQETVKDLLETPTAHTAYIMLALGYPTEPLPPNDRWVERKVHWNKF
ncbi:MAG: nitroreductase family protein [Candidatus Nomurabacteria bacterium]|jgi:nitroreductase|nr:nitroreductase family protein [Candidatus Nomurabacteria bacterium]